MVLCCAAASVATVLPSATDEDNDLWNVAALFRWNEEQANNETIDFSLSQEQMTDVLQEESSFDTIPLPPQATQEVASTSMETCLGTGPGEDTEITSSQLLSRLD